MTKHDLIAFRAVARLKNFTRAAEELFISQPSLSNKIANVEKEVGTLLFERNKRTVKLTQAGQIFYRESTELLVAHENFLEDVRLAAKYVEHSLNIAFMGASLAEKFLPHTQTFQKNYSEYNLHFEFMDFKEIYSALKNEQIDLAITGDLGLLTLENIRTQKIFTAYSNLILPKDYPLLKNKMPNLSLLKNEKFILLDKKISPKGYERVFEICASFGFSPTVTHTCDSTDEIFFHIRTRQGISILPDFDCPPEKFWELAYIPIKNAGQSFSIVAAWNKSNKNPGIVLFIDALKNFLESHK